MMLNLARKYTYNQTVSIYHYFRSYETDFTFSLSHPYFYNS
jgi:hypothetical protein